MSTTERATPARLMQRAKALRALRDFFDARAFLEVETPLLVPSPGLDLHLDAFAVPTGRGAERYLITSPEYQMKRLLVAGLERIYQVCKCFRRGELGTQHQPEFTMLEWYRAHAGSAEVMADTEELVAHLALALHGTTKLRFRGEEIDVAPPWPRMTVREAFAQVGESFDDLVHDETRFFLTLVEKIEPMLGRTRPTFLVRWPASMASLAKLHDDDPSVADRFEGYVCGLELCNGFGELTDPNEQRSRFEQDQRTRQKVGKPVYPIDERFIEALEQGMPPAGGNALGVDRLVMLLLDAADIAEVVSFPAHAL